MRIFDPKQIQKQIGSALSSLALVISIVLCVTVLIQVNTNGYVQIGGISLFRVVTGSMEPEIPVGSLLICQRTDIQDIGVDDIICFRSKNPQIMGKTITHRVLSITVCEDGSIKLETKGDANLSADAEYVTVDNLIGRVTYYSKESNLMVSLVKILNDQVGFMILILFPTLLIAGFILRSCIKNMKRDIDQALEEQRKNEEPKPVYTEEEYAEMLVRIKNELYEELSQNVEENSKPLSENSKTE